MGKGGLVGVVVFPWRVGHLRDWEGGRVVRAADEEVDENENCGDDATWREEVCAAGCCVSLIAVAVAVECGDGIARAYRGVNEVVSSECGSW